MPLKEKKWMVKISVMQHLELSENCDSVTPNKLVRCLTCSVTLTVTSADDAGPFPWIHGAGEVSRRSNIVPQTHRYTGHTTKCMYGAASVALVCAEKNQPESSKK